jgi:transposase
MSDEQANELTDRGADKKAPVRRDWRIPDELWERIQPLIPTPPPPPKPHPLGCHRQRVPDRNAMDAIFFLLRTGCQWNALNETGICSSSTSHRRFQEWVEAGVFEKLWAQGLAEYDELVGLDWAWLALDGAMTKAPGIPHGQAEREAETQVLIKRGRRRRRLAPIPPTEAKGEPSVAS